MEPLKYTLKADVKNPNKKYINFINLDQELRMKLRTKFGAMISKSGKEAVYATEHPEDENDPNTAKIVKAMKVIAHTGNYETPTIEEILNRLASARPYTATQEENKELQENFDKQWQEFFEHINDPDVQELLKSLSNFGMEDETYGWEFSVFNAMLIKTQRPNATFVQTQNQWMDLWDREVVEGAKPIIVKIPKSKKNRRYNKDSERLDKMGEVGYDADTQFKDLSTQQQEYIDIKVVEWLGNGQFMSLLYYDVADTRLIQGATEDRWATEVGFENNLNGKLNAPAQMSKDDAESENKDVIQQKLYGSESGNVKLACDALAKGVKASFPDLQIVIPPKNCDEKMYKNIYRQNLLKVSDLFIETKKQIVKPENRAHGAQLATIIVMCLTKVSPEFVARKLRNGELTMDDYMSLRTVVNSIITLINRNRPMKESNNFIEEEQYPLLNSVDDLLSMIGMTRDEVPQDDEETLQQEEMQQEAKARKGKQIREDFFRLFNRINKQLF